MEKIIFSFILWHFVGLGISLIVNSFIVFRGGKNALLFRYLFLQGALILWIIIKIGKTLSPNIELRYFFDISQYISVCFLGALFFVFSWQFLFDKLPPLLLRILLYSLSLFFFCSAVSNPLHHLFYTSFTFFVITEGPLFYGHSIFSYLVIFVSIILILYAVFHKNLSRWNILIGLGGVIPLFLNVLYVLKILESSFDITPLVMSGSTLLFGTAAFRSQFLEILPIAQSQLLKETSDALILTGRKSRVLQTHIVHSKTVPEEKITQNRRVYRLNRTKRLFTLKIFHYADVTDLEHYIRQLTERNHQIAQSIKEIERSNRLRREDIENRLRRHASRELHDILGHSLTQVILLLRTMSQHPKGISFNLERCVRIIEESRAELNRSLTSAVKKGESLSIALQRIISEMPSIGIRLEFEVFGYEKYLSDLMTASLLRCTQEGITNALKHSGADTIYLTLFYKEKELIVIIADTGKGDPFVRKGNGLRVMEERLREIGGEMKITTEPNQGTQLTFLAPIS